MNILNTEASEQVLLERQKLLQSDEKILKFRKGCCRLVK